MVALVSCRRCNTKSCNVYQLMLIYIYIYISYMYILSTRIPIALPSVINNTRRTIGHVKTTQLQSDLHFETMPSATRQSSRYVGDVLAIPFINSLLTLFINPICLRVQSAFASKRLPLNATIACQRPALNTFSRQRPAIRQFLDMLAICWRYLLLTFY